MVFSGGHSERKKDNRDAFKAQIKKEFHSIKNYKLIQYLKTKECKTLMEDNKITMYVAAGYILLGREGTVENFYQFLEPQMDNDKRTTENALKYSGLL